MSRSSPPADNAFTPDLARIIPTRLSAPGDGAGRGREPGWQDEVRRRVSVRRRQRLGEDPPVGDSEAPALDVELDRTDAAPEAPGQDPAARLVFREGAELAGESADREGPRLVWSTGDKASAEAASVPSAANKWSLGDEEPAPAAPAGRPRAEKRPPAWLLDEPEEEAADAAPLERPAFWAERFQAGAFDLAVLVAIWATAVYFAGRAAQANVEGLRPVWPAILVYFAGLGFLYAMYFTGTSGRTIGKIVFGLKVVDVAGRPPGYGRALARAALGTAGILLGALGLVPMFFDPARRTLHDRLLRVRVVKL